MRPSVLGAAGLLRGCEFHEFDTRVVGIVEVKLPFAVAADFRLFAAAPTVLAKLLFRGVDVGDAEGDVVHDAESVMVCVDWDVEHVFDPAGAVGDLHVHPAGFVVFPSAVPVEVKAKDVFVKAIFGGAVFDDEAGVKNARADLFGGSSKHGARVKLHEDDGITLGIVETEMGDGADISGNRADGDVTGKEEAAHPGEVRCGKGNFGE